MIPIIKTYFNQDIYFVLLTISFLLIGILKANYWKHTKLLLLGLFAQRYSNQFLREDNAFTERINIITFFLMVINFSTILIKIPVSQSSIDIVFLITIITAYYLIKAVIIQLCGKVFMIKELAKLGVFFSFLFDRVLGIILFPLVVILYFFSFEITSFLLGFIFLLMTLIFIIKLFWLWRIAAKAFGLSVFYIFLYLCTLEIFPVLLLVKGLRAY